MVILEVADKQDYNRHNREYDEEQQKQHFQSWETFWGRPGYGAPREVINSQIKMKISLNKNKNEAPREVSYYHYF